MFAVTGIAERVGAAQSSSLVAAAQPARAVIRDPGKSAPCARLRCDIAIAEPEDTSAITTAFEGTAAVFCAIDTHAHQRQDRSESVCVSHSRFSTGLTFRGWHREP
jgi:uncharacterized protein YbjT (DUF2867 family)